MKLSDFVVKEAVIAELKATDRDGVIRELVEALAAAKAVSAGDVDVIVKAIVDREKHGSTGFGKGVAVPHGKLPAVKKRVAAIGRSAVGVDFAALDQSPVFSVVLLLSPQNNPDGHLQAMENIFRHLQDDKFRRWMRQAATKKDILDLLDDADQTSATR